MTSDPTSALQPSTALLTDHYELTMLDASLHSGTAMRPSVFELFPRRLPSGRRYGVVAGVGRALEAIENFRFDDAILGFLTGRGIIGDDAAHWLSQYRFSGNIRGYGEGEVYFPGAPLLVVESTFAEACILETLLLSIYNYDSAVASAASRMVAMSLGRPVIEMGSRRAHEHAAVAAARAAHIAGFTSTSNLEAGRRWGVPTVGTAAHSFTLLHDSEADAFRAQVDVLGVGTTLLVDTYDIAEGVRTAVDVAGKDLGAVRLDSGDLAIVAREVREQLDSLGAHDTRIVVTSDLDEWQIAVLQSAPVDGYGVGTRLVTGSGHPTCGFVYKLVARATDDHSPAQPVRKKSESKGTVGGSKFALRRLDESGRAECDLIGIGTPPEGDHNDRPLMRELVRAGEVVGHEPLSAARERHERAIAELPRTAAKMSDGEPALDTLMVNPDGSIIVNPYHRREAR